MSDAQDNGKSAMLAQTDDQCDALFMGAALLWSLYMLMAKDYGARCVEAGWHQSTGCYNAERLDAGSDMEEPDYAAIAEAVREGIAKSFEDVDLKDDARVIRSFHVDEIVVAYMPKDDPNEDAKDAARYRWLCEWRDWPEEVNAAIDCGSKLVIDEAIDMAMAQEKGDTSA